MDATSAIIVVVLFVVTIFSSFGGNQGYTAPSAPPREEVSATVSKPEVPDPTYFEDVTQNPRSAIWKFVSKYRNKEESDAITAGIMKYSKVYGVNPKLVTALMARESRFNPKAVSSSGAVGLGQLLPSTCKTVGISNPYDIDQNAKGTARYMKYLLGRFKKYRNRVKLALAGYLEGPNIVERKLGYKPHTAAYVRDILTIYRKI